MAGPACTFQIFWSFACRWSPLRYQRPPKAPRPRGPLREESDASKSGNGVCHGPNFVWDDWMITEELFLGKACTCRGLAQRSLLHRAAFSQRSFYTENFLHRAVSIFYTQKRLHTEEYIFKNWKIPWLERGAMTSVKVDLNCWLKNMSGWLSSPPLWKMMEFVNWDHEIPNIWKGIKFRGSSHHQPDIFVIPRKIEKSFCCLLIWGDNWPVGICGWPENIGTR